MRGYVSRVQWRLQNQVSADLLSMLWLANEWRSSIHFVQLLAHNLDHLMLANDWQRIKVDGLDSPYI